MASRWDAPPSAPVLQRAAYPTATGLPLPVPTVPTIRSVEGMPARMGDGPATVQRQTGAAPERRRQLPLGAPPTVAARTTRTAQALPAASSAMPPAMPSAIPPAAPEPALPPTAPPEPTPPDAVPPDAERFGAEESGVEHSVPGLSSGPGPTGAAAARGAAGLEPEDLLKALYDPLLRRLKTELRLDRERRGTIADLPRYST